MRMAGGKFARRFVWAELDRENKVASTRMTETDAQELFAVQERSYQAAGRGIRESYPQDAAMDATQLAAFLDRKRYAVLATSRPDGRPHAAPISFCVWNGAFWIASVRGARVQNLRAKRYASIVVVEGEGPSHRAIIAEGPVNLHPVSSLRTMPEEFQALVRTRLGDIAKWAVALIALRPERLFSYDATKAAVSA